jgi:hypothetical protein
MEQNVPAQESFEEIVKSVISKKDDLEILQRIDTIHVDDQNESELKLIDSCVKREDLEEYRKGREKSLFKANNLINQSNYTAHSNKQHPNENTISHHPNPLLLPHQHQNSNHSNSKQITWGTERNNSDMNIGSLLKYFKSESFDCWAGVSSLYKYPSAGVHDYLCNALYSMKEEDVEFYLLQLW